MVHSLSRLKPPADPVFHGPAEWLETDGLGGFACCTESMTPTRRYHGLLLSRLPGTAKRYLFLAGFDEKCATGSRTMILSSLRHEGEDAIAWPAQMTDFELVPWPRATFRQGACQLTREIQMVQGRPVTLIHYRLRAGGPVTLTLRPLLACRESDALHVQNDVLNEGVEELPNGFRTRPYPALPAMALTLETTASGQAYHSQDPPDPRDPAPPSFRPEPRWYPRVQYATDLARGYDGIEDLFSPGVFEIHLDPERQDGITLAATIDGAVANPGLLWQVEEERRRAAMPAEPDMQSRCALAAGDFLYREPQGRLGILAGFPWFGEWGRDTFIALPGLTLARGQTGPCAEVLSGAVEYLQDGLLPNIFGDGRADSHYGSVDASLWFARAVLLYQRAGGAAVREQVRDEYLPALLEIAECYRDGSGERIEAMGIGGDDDMLIHAGTPDLNPTWMDAMPASGPVTPRHGCPVEICALWCSLLLHLAEFDDSWAAAARRAGDAFIQRFWLSEGAYLADVWRDGERDESVRPNMVLAAALELSPLSREQRLGVLHRAEAELLTPYGLRTLTPRHRDYVSRYQGDPEQRDAAYHQGTVWPWLLGFYCEASLRVDAGPKNRKLLRALWGALEQELGRGGLEHLSEVFDGDSPYHRGGTFAQAWNTGEALRALALIDGSLPLGGPLGAAGGTASS